MLHLVRASFTEETIHRNPKRGFAIGKEAVVGNLALRQHFKALCRKHHFQALCSDNKDTDLASIAVYSVVVGKIVHSRFAVPFLLFKMKHIKPKAKIALRNTLKVAEAGGFKHQTSVTVTPDKKQNQRNPTSPNKKSKNLEAAPIAGNDDQAPRLVLHRLGKAADAKRKDDYPSPTSSQAKAARFEKRVLINQTRAALGTTKCGKRKKKR